MKIDYQCVVIVLLVLGCAQDKRNNAETYAKQISNRPAASIFLMDTPPPKVDSTGPSLGIRIQVPKSIYDADVFRGEDGELRNFEPPLSVTAEMAGANFTTYNTDHGLGLSVISSGWRDRMGNLWFGTAGGGVSRYDGMNFTTFTTRHGLAHNTVRTITEDHDGNLWFGTGGGITRYDGISFKTLTTTHGLGHNVVWSALEDSRGNLWFGTFGGGVSRFDGTSFETFTIDDGLASNTVWSILEDNAGNLWFGTNKGVSRYDGEELVTLTTHEGLVQNVVWSIGQDQHGDIWFGTEAGLSRYDGRRFESIRIGPGSLSNTIKAIFEDSRGILWFGTDGGGITRFDPDAKDGREFITLTTKQGLAHDALRSITEDKHGNLWFGTEGGGVSRYDGESFTIFGTDQGLAYDAVRCITEDSNGVLWFGTNGGGISRYNGKTFSTYNVRQGLASNFVWCAAEDGHGNMWFGTYGGGVSCFDGLSFYTLTTEHGLANNAVMCIHEDQQGYIWFGTNGGGVSRFDGKKITTFTTTQGLGHNDVRNIVEDKTGNLWFATNGGGISRYDGRSFTTFTTEQGLPSNVVWSLIEDKSGNLWLGTGSGLCRYDGTTFVTFSTREGLPNDVAYDIVEDGYGVIWIGTNLGLCGLKFRSSSHGEITAAGLLGVSNAKLDDYMPVWEIYNRETGYPVRSVNFNGMCVTKVGLPGGGGEDTNVIWSACGDNKVIRFEGQAISSNTNPLQAYIQSIQIDETTLPWYSLAQSPLDSTVAAQQEALAFGNLLPTDERLRIQESFGDINFDSITPFYPVPKNLVLPYRHNQVSFYFGVRDTGINSFVRYQYILEGYDKAWSPVTKATSASFGNIDAGAYTFKLRARGGEGVWSQPITYAFVVLPPWWQTWWAYVFYGLIFVLIVITVRNETLRRERLKNEIKLSQLETDKYHELDILKSRFFANISHEFRTPLTLLLAPLQRRLSKSIAPDERAEFTSMHRNATRLLDLVNQLLDLSRIEAGSMKLRAIYGNLNEFIQAISSQFASMAQSRDIHFEVISSSAIELWFDPDKIEKIVVNLLSNAFKFTPSGGSIGVVMTVENENARIDVSDSGIGMSVNEIDQIFDRFYQIDESSLREYEGFGIGLSLVREITELHHGTVAVSSEPGKGSCFTVRIPMGKEHLTQQEMITEGERSPIPDRYNAPVYYVDTLTSRPQAHIEVLSTILVIEDNTELRDYLTKSLCDKYNVLEASNGHEGLLLAQSEVPDLILTDLMMPKMDGLELCKRIRENEKTCHIPLILLTAKADVETKLEGLNTGADDYLSKPFNVSEVLIRIHNLIESRTKLRKLFSSPLVLKPSDIKGTSLDDRFIRKVMEIIEVHIADPLFSVELLADEVSMSTVQLYRKLKALTGHPPNDLVRGIRLERAASLLEQRVGNVADVAYQVGFNNLSYFSKCFKEKFKQTPSAFLRQKNSE
ncbi:MAG: ATP-binding protein [Cyclobacteriaceae bacterium]|nr:ATP-binding protein [Cyclobacteriaceae bacterium]MDH5249591.1 ATP-binding protein [Cyclobacteriaceae bacterium]